MSSNFSIPKLEALSESFRAVSERMRSLGGEAVTYYPGEDNGQLLAADASGEFKDTKPLCEELKFIAKAKGKKNVPHIAAIASALTSEPDSVPQVEEEEVGQKIVTGAPELKVAQKAEVGNSYLIGLGFSGGGIRSGTFCLGVMQKLAGAKIFKHVDYLSTVSGGGYIGSSLAWWLSGKPSAENPDSPPPSFDTDTRFPFGMTDPKHADQNESLILAYLRENGKYLIPGNGITIASGVAILLRAVLLNLLVWIPIIAALFMGIRWIGEQQTLKQIADNLPFDLSGLMTALFEISIWVALSMVVFYLLSCVNYSFLVFSRRDKAKTELPLVRQTTVHSDQSVTTKENLVRWLLKRPTAVMWVLLNLAVFGMGLLAIAAITGGLEAAGGVIDSGSSSVSGFLEWLNETRYLPVAAVALLMFLYAVSSRLTAAVIIIAALAVAGWELFTGQLLGRALSSIGVVIVLIFLTYYVGRRAREALKEDGLSVRYSGRRAFERVFGSLFVAATALLLVATIPIVHKMIMSTPGIAAGDGFFAGLLGVAGGVGSALWGFVQSRGKGGSGQATKVVLRAGAGLLVYGLLLSGFALSEKIYDSSPTGSEQRIQQAPIHSKSTGTSPVNKDLDERAIGASEGQGAPRPEQGNDQKNGMTWDQYAKRGFWFLLIVSVASGWLTNLNYISLGRYYRDRLMEAFMPNWSTVMSRKSGAAGLADDLKVSHLWRPTKEKSPKEPSCAAVGPYPILNTNVVLVNSPERKYSQRGGDNFIISPKLCGGNATGWTVTETFDAGEMTLASAMAISGAAANPRGGVGGKGITTSQTVSLVMSLLNFRLGYWVNHPSKRRPTMWHKQRPSHFYPSAAYSVPGRGYTENSGYLELSDGGHFENLAIYELVRRRCAVVIVCDGGQDAASSYSDFVTAIQRIKQDFGATVVLKDRYGPELLVPRKRDNTYPKDAEYADKGYFVGTIDYGDRGGGPWPQKGLLIYMKTTMIGSLSMTAKGYKGAHPDFPDQTTGDQFFDEEQFEAYRELGYRIAEQAIDDLGLDDCFKTGRPDLDAGGDWIDAIKEKAACAANKARADCVCSEEARSRNPSKKERPAGPSRAPSQAPAATAKTAC